MNDVMVFDVDPATGIMPDLVQVFEFNLPE